MGKVALLPLLLVLACLWAGLYGALHNQVSYTVSPEYFHKYKFIQFDIPEPLHGRVGAALVGWQASWWMGLFLGAPVLLVGLILPDGKTYFTHAVRAFAVVTATALLAGLAALAWASAAVTEATLPPFAFPAGVVDRVAFARAGVMHDFSYLGGALGVVTGVVYLAVARARLLRRA
jgi:hypothetical protein